MFKQLERLALQPQRWGLTGEAEESLSLCVFCLIWCFFWYWLRWRRCGSTVVAGLQLEEESPLRAARLPDHWDDCLFWMTTADNERPDQEPTDCPRTSCIIYSPLLHLCFVFTQTLGLAFAAASAHTEQSKSTAAVWSVHLQRWRVLTAPLHHSMDFHLAGLNKVCAYSYRDKQTTSCYLLRVTNLISM